MTVEQAPDNLADRLVLGVDTVLRTLTGQYRTQRPSPAVGLAEPDLDDDERSHAAGLMRVNHTGEVCAQALYEGQALTAWEPGVRDVMHDAAREEADHLAWCHERLRQLDSRVSVLNPIWYGASFGLGAVTGLLGDRISLGFVAATEDQVCRHLERHLDSLPAHDAPSRAIVTQMHADETRHGTQALGAGGLEFPEPLRRAMTLASSVMTRTSYYL